jgi:hypothetical protein
LFTNKLPPIKREFSIEISILFNFGDIVMKKLMFIAFVTVLVVALSGNVIGKDDKPVKAGSESVEVSPASPRAGHLRPKRPKRPDVVGRGGRKPAMNRSREQFVESKVKQMKLNLERQVTVHEEFVAQLEEIKKIAIGEKAKKTAAKIQELIDNDNDKFAKKQKAMKKEMELFKARMKESPRQRGTGPQRSLGPRPPKGKRGGGEELQKGGDKVGEKKK